MGEVGECWGEEVCGDDEGGGGEEWKRMRETRPVPAPSSRMRSGVVFVFEVEVERGGEERMGKRWGSWTRSSLRTCAPPQVWLPREA